MAKNKAKNYFAGGLSPLFLEKLKRQTLINSAASSLRLSGAKITNKEVERIINFSASKSADDKVAKKILLSKQGRSTRYRKL